MGVQGTKWRKTLPKIFNRLSRVHERYRRQTDGRAMTRSLKTAVYTNVNGDIVSYTSETAKIKKDDITQQHIAKCQ